jgi:folate-binding protein YgfZ
MLGHSLPLPAPGRAVRLPVGGFVTYIPRAQFAGALEALTHAGAMPIDDVTAEILRVEAGIPRFLVDMSEDTIPLEAGLDHAISHTKGCYVGQEIIVGLTFDGDAVPAAGQDVFVGEQKVGRLTSAVRSVALDRSIGLATLHRDAAAAGTLVTLADGLTALVTTLPFAATVRT